MKLHPDALSLPALAIAGEVNQRLSGGNRLIVTAPPGAGKSTLLPLTIHEERPGKIIMLEPRRVAARQIAERMAHLLGEPVGRTVGYRIRFESKVSKDTEIEVLTEGLLTRKLIDDPTLDGVSTVIFDEFHERSLLSDEALALTLQTQQLLREDLRIVLMSATLDSAALSRTLAAPVVESEGRMFPVTIERADEATPENCAEKVAETIRRVHREHEGDILAFLPGEGEIRRCAELLGTALGSTALYPLYGMLSSSEQKAAIAPSAPGQRKVVLATPIAETSLTIEGVRVVVDSGLCRKSVFDPRSALSRLETERISLDRATQRTGRAGRVAPGICYRLWSIATEERMAPTRLPEVLEADLASLVLDAAAWGEPRVEMLPWLTPLPLQRVAQARELLQSLGALSGEGSVTALGRKMAALPCHPRMARMLLKDSPALAADIAAIVEERDPLAGKADAGLDLRLKALRQARAARQGGRLQQLAAQYASLVHVTPSDGPADPYEAGALVAAAYPERVARHREASQYLLSSGDVVSLDLSDPLNGCEWLAVAHCLVRPGGVGRIFLAAPVAAEDLHPLARQREVVFWDNREGRAVARQELRLGQHLLEEKPIQAPGEQLRVVCEALKKYALLDFNPEVQNLQRRIAAVASWHPELELPDVSTEALLESAPAWLPLYAPKAFTASELGKIDLSSVIWGLLSYPQQQSVERLAPSHITVPTGSRIRVEYRQGADAPVVRVRLQECFGLADTPRVDDGRLPVLMELLSPGYKPVQLTSDLRSFWGGTYFEVRKELRRRYPKHAWPDNPLEADPVRGTKRR